MGGRVGGGTALPFLCANRRGGGLIIDVPQLGGSYKGWAMCLRCNCLIGFIRDVGFFFLPLFFHVKHLLCRTLQQCFITHRHKPGNLFRCSSLASLKGLTCWWPQSLSLLLLWSPMNIANILINTITRQMLDHFELPHLHKGVRFY